MSIFGAPVPSGNDGEYVRDANEYTRDANGNVVGPVTRNATERTIDGALDVVESDNFGYAVSAGTIGVAAATGGAAAAGLAAASVGIGMATAAVGAYGGNMLGHAVMSRMPGFNRLTEDGEMPATMGMFIAHTSPWATLGAIALGALAAACVVFIPGLGVLAAVAIGGLIAGIGVGFASAAGQYGTNKGKIETGSLDVHFEGKPVARVTDLISCSSHGPHKVAQGAETVFANNWPIARIGHKTTCNGTINDGCKTIAVDIDTSAIALDIDGGWLERGQRLFVVALDFLPIGPRKKGPDADGPPPPRGDRSADVDTTPPGTRCACGDPIDVVSGQLMDTRTDLHIPATIPLNLTRTYARSATGLMGNGWSSTWGRHLQRKGDLTVYQDPDGLNITFHTPRDKVLSSHMRMPHLELMGRRDGTLYLYDNREQLIYSFGRTEGDRIYLTEIRDRNDNHIDLIYDDQGLKSVSHSDGFGIDVTSREGIMQSAALRDHPDGDCTFQWDYSHNNQLIESRSAQTGILKYSYDEKGRITRWADNKSTEVFYEYDHTDRIVRSWSTSGHMGVLLDHNPEEQTTLVTDSLGHQSMFHYNADGLVTKEVDALGGVWLTEWDFAFNVTKRINPLGAVSTYTYNARGDITSAEDPSGAKIAWEYDKTGQLTARTNAVGAVETIQYDDKGNVARIIDADGGEVGFRRGEKGEILRVELPGGGQERVYYDHLMRPRMTVTGDGHETRMRYDVEGRLTMFQDGEGKVTKYDVTRGPLNPRGAIRQATLPDGTANRMDWDIEGKLSGVTDAEGQTRTFTYGAFDLPITATDAAGYKMTLEHDREMRMTAVINAAGERYDYTYDPVGALIAERDFSGLVTRYERDLASRVTTKIAPDGIKTHYTYSDRGDLIEMRVGDDVTRFAYDPRGLMTLAENATAKIEYKYDMLGRVVSEKLDGREVRSTYAQSSGLRIGRDGDVLSLESSYSNGGLLKDIRVAGHDALLFQHDKRGLEVLRKSATGFALSQGYTENAQLKSQIAGHIDQLPDDARQGMMSISTRYDPGYGSVARTYRSYDWDKAGRAIGVVDAKWGQTRLNYDPRGQVSATQHVDKSGYEVARAQFAYDATRNVAGVQTATGQEPVQQSVGGRVLSRGRAFYRYDGCGRVIEKRVEEPGFRPKIWKMEWDGEGRLVRLTTPDSAVWAYGYDALGRRIRRLKLVAGTSEESDAPGYLPPGGGMAYQWDGDQIAAEAPVYADGTVAWDQAEAWVYEPGTFRPMAKIVGDELYYVVTDHIGTPRELITEDGKRAVWRARIGLWGAVEDEQVWKRPAANDDHPPLTCNIRFQGQWYDEESGLHYNRFRYYDPESTQYLSPDPIGLAGGTRPQAYVTDPNGWVDPFGLAKCPTARARKIRDNAQSGKVRRGKDYHGRLENAREADILSNPDGVYEAKNGNLIFHQGNDIVVTHGSGGAQGNVITSYGESGPRGDSGAAIFGGSPTDPGNPVTSDMILNGEIPRPNGGTLPPATRIDPL